MPRRFPRLWLSLSICCSVFTCACVTDHDLFAASGGSGGSSGGGSGRGSGGTSYSADGDAAGDARGGTGGHAGSPEPPGPRKITFVNGITDAPWISFCFSKVTKGVEGPLLGRPFPAASLSYGNTLTVDAVPGIDFETEAVRPYVVAASPDAVSGLTCGSLAVIAGAFVGKPPPEDASIADAPFDAVPDILADREMAADSSDADARLPDGASGSDARAADGSGDAAHERATPPPHDAGGGARVPNIRVSALSVIPAGTFGAELHYLFGLGGCMGGPGVRDPSELSVCGEHFAPDHPTLVPVLVTLSRIVTDGHVGLQFVDATPAVRAADLRLSYAGTTASVVKNVVVGAIRPTVPYAARTASQLGPNDSNRIQIFADASTKPIYDEPWSKTLAVGDIAPVRDGHTYTLVLIGPYPGFSAREWWNDPLVTIVANDP